MLDLPHAAQAASIDGERLDAHQAHVHAGQPDRIYPAVDQPAHQPGVDDPIQHHLDQAQAFLGRRAQPLDGLERDVELPVQVRDLLAAAVDDDDAVFRQQSLDGGHEPREKSLVFDLVAADLEDQHRFIARAQVLPPDLVRLQR